jgi:hypothetical protein
MAAGFNKWLFIFLLPASLYIGNKIDQEKILFPKILSEDERQGVRGRHPIHVSVVEINHNPTDKTLEISCRIFTDDFERVLAQNYKTRVDLINPDRKAMDKLISDYIKIHLSIRADGKPVSFSYLGFETEKEVVNSYLQVDNITTVNKIELVDKLMHDLFTDQTNLIHVTIGGKRKSTKLDYPEKDAILSF